MRYINGKHEFRGEKCTNCSFNEISHYYPSTEFDMNEYPCKSFSGKNIKQIYTIINNRKKDTNV
jgi:hypothetical protein